MDKEHENREDRGLSLQSDKTPEGKTLPSDEEKIINTNSMNIDTMRDGNRDSDNAMAESKMNPELKKPLDSKAKKLSNAIQDTLNSYVSISKSNLIFSLVFYVCMIIYLEIILHFLVYRSFDIRMIYPVLFALPFAAVLTFINGLFKPVVNRVLMYVITFLITLIFQVQLVYYNVFKVYFSFQTLGMADDAITEFGSEVITAIKANIGGMILLLVPLLLLVLVLNPYISFEQRGVKEQGVLLVSAAIFHFVAIMALLLSGKGDYTPYDLYFNSQVHDLCGKQLGIVTMTRLDIGNLLREEEELVLIDAVTPLPTLAPESVPEPTASPVMHQANSEDGDEVVKTTSAPTPTPVDTSPNVMDIDFHALAQTEKDSTIRTLHEYFATVPPTNKNKYTGYFKDYNLIMITAEGFSPYAIHEEKTPTLYKLVREGFVFNNFYTALWQTSTSDGEYVAMTGLIPTGTRSMYNGRKNLWPFSLGWQFKNLGVDSKAYHNHTYTYYQRDETHPNLGYDYKGKGNGLNLTNPNVWPGSDLELMEASVDDYISKERFHVYYMTVSGHMNYTFEGNAMAYKNRNLVKDLPYSEDGKAYIACQMELDKALAYLITRLEEAGVADRTVIALSADHYPYGWEKYKLDELAGHELDPDFEIYKNHFILWNPGMKESVVIDEPCSSLDILPTLLNLFGFEYDSRLLMGQDILSDAPPLVILSNRSFITDKVMFNSETGEVTQLTKEPLPENYIQTMNKIVKNKFKVSQSILKEDYYRHLFQ